MRGDNRILLACGLAVIAAKATLEKIREQVQNIE